MTTYTANTATDTIAPGSFAATEWLSQVGGFIAGCGEAAFAVLVGATQGRILGPSDVTTLIKEAVNAHVTVGKYAAGGQASPDTIQYLSQQTNVPLTSLDWQSALAWAGKRDVILGLGHAEALGGSDSTVTGHYITIVGTQGPNYIVSDPNTVESTRGQYVVYTPQQISDAQPFWAAVPTNPPATTQTLSNPGYPGPISAGGTSAITIPALTGLGNFFNMVVGWFTPPTRALKFVAGLALMGISLVVVFLPDIAAGAASATGNPEVGAAILSTQRGPQGVTGAGIRALGTAAGRQRTATKQEARTQRAQQTVRLNTQRASERAQARTMEQARTTARRAATTNRLNRNVNVYNTPSRSGSPGNQATPSTARPVPSSPPTDFSVPKAGHLGPLHKNVPADKNRKAPPRPQQPTPLPTVQRAPSDTPVKPGLTLKVKAPVVRQARTPEQERALRAVRKQQQKSLGKNVARGPNSPTETPEELGRRLSRNARQRFLRASNKVTDKIRRGETP